MHWYVKSNKDGRIFGPYTKEELADKITVENQHNFLFSQNKIQWYETLPQPQKQKMLGKYKILRELGRGGMGVVYHALDTSLQRECALKVLTGKRDDSAVERFFNEARAIAQINHPNIIKVHEIHTSPMHFFAMEYISGQTLIVYLSSRRFTVNEKLQLFMKICDAIALAHSHKILHRDLKPENILVRNNGSPVVLDFGIAKDSKTTSNLTKKGEIVGTPRYIAPEIVLEQPFDDRSDVYSLGVILYQMLTGRPPFDVDNFFSLVHALTSKEPLPPSQLNASIPKNSDLEILCLKALEKKPQKRIESAAYLQQEIEKIVKDLPISLRKPTTLEQMMRWYRGSGIVGRIFVMLIMAIAILSGITLFTFNSVQEALAAKQQALYKKKEANDTIIEIAEKVPQSVRVGQLQQALVNLQRAFVALDDSFAERTVEQNAVIYRRLTNILNFSVLTNLPRIENHDIIDLKRPLHVSASGRFVLACQNNYLYTWDIRQQQNISIANSQKIEIGKDARFLCSTKDDRFVVYCRDKKVFAYDQQQQRNISIASYTGKVMAVASDNSRFLTYNTNNKVWIYDLRLQKKVAYFTVNAISKIKISQDGLSVAVLGYQAFYLYSVKKKKCYTITDKNSFSYGCKFVFDQSRYLYIVTTFGLTIYDCVSYTKKYVANPYSSHFLKSDPIVVHDRLIFGTDRGGIITYFRENDFRPHRFVKFPVYLREEVHGLYPAKNFVCVAKGAVLQIRNILSLDTTFSTPYDGGIVSLHQLSNEYVLRVMSQTKYTSYKFVAQTLSCGPEFSETLRRLYYASDELKQMMRKIELAQRTNTVFLPHQLGYLGWVNGKFVLQYNLKKGMPHSFGYDGDSRMVVTYDDFKIDLVNTKDLSIEKSMLLSLNKSQLEGEPRQTCFLDRETIFTTTTHREMCRYHIASDVYEKFMEKIHAKSIFCQRVDDAVFVGTKHGFCVVDLQQRSVKNKFLYEDPTLTTFSVANNGSIFASGGGDRVTLWKNYKNPQQKASFRVPGSVNNICFSPNNEYLAIFTSDSLFIYDVELKQLLEAYIGYFKSTVSNVSKDWNHIYFPIGMGDVIVFNQGYFFDYEQQQQKIMGYDIVNEKYNAKALVEVMQQIRRKLRK
ncbi:serine/threonine protein kinase [Candidatus Uabimicrobium amorphum]|uniref:Protein kinase n=1 Tax=Uabimicrobium amorphum TaxID=2596890 RepID=A0A5S9F0L3_UABAM|nr:serine/threonine-protein kinase [Candidatus Uabimicrobium amorphum]BBM81727.1 protein kinase [Candidatus Uabimicrobium amorphum]